MDNIVRVCAEACRVAYDPCYPGYDVDDLRFTVGQSDGNTLIAFRGTADIGNVLEDLDIVPETTPDGHLGHGGFVGAYRKLLPEVLSHISRDKSVVVTGHSLGGAIAVLFAELLGCEVVTFGCPRIYLKTGTTPILNHIRVVRDGDPVPMIPRLLYKHDCGPVVLYDGSTGIEVKEHFIEGYIQSLERSKS